MKHANAIIGSSATCCVTALAGLTMLAGLSRPGDPDAKQHLSDPHENAFVDCMLQWDGQWYLQVATRGYNVSDDTATNVAFFPAFPLLARLVTRATGFDPAIVLIATSHAALLFAMCGFAFYADATGRSPVLSVFSLALFPTSFFFAMAYSESLFLALVVASMLSIKQQRSHLVSAFLVGLATAARPVGVALVPVLAYAVIRSARSMPRVAFQLAFILPISTWGIVAYMGYLQFRFDAPFAFIETQDFWRFRPAVGASEKILALVTLEPLWVNYLPSRPYFQWAKSGAPNCVFSNLQLANPILFASAVGLILYGTKRKWLEFDEMLLATGLLTIPYVTRAYEYNMYSHGRFVLVSFPVFLVIAELLKRASPICRLTYLVVSTLFFTSYCWSWANGHLAI